MKNEITFKTAARVLFWLTSLMVTILLLLPGQELPSTDLSDKSEHVIAFFTLSSLGLLAYPKRMITLCLGLVVAGSLLEITQIAIPGRTASILDATANAAGVMSGLIIHVAVVRLLASLKPSRLHHTR